MSEYDRDFINGNRNFGNPISNIGNLNTNNNWQASNVNDNFYGSTMHMVRFSMILSILIDLL
jgi:hypothetical protein